VPVGEKVPSNLFNVPDGADREDALASACRVTYLVAGAVRDLARVSGDEAAVIVQRLTDAKV
jgi:hypothetical protein